MTRGRKPNPPAEQIGESLGQMTPEAVAEEAVIVNADQMVLDYSEVLVRVGRMQTADMNQKLNHVIAAKEFVAIRDSKKYKGLAYRDKEGKQRHVIDLEEFCEVFIGRSYPSVMEDVRNMNALGDELYERALTLGLTTRNFRDIRGLQQDDQELVKEAIATKSREAVIEVMESLVVKHSKEIKKKDKAIAELQGDLDAARQITAKKDEKINDLHTQIHRRETLPELELTEKQLQELAVEAKLVVAGMSRFSTRLHDVFQREEPPQVLIDHAMNMLTFMAQEILAIQSRFTLPIKLEQEMDPDYITKLVKQSHQESQEVTG
jgi:hypothetical protein